MQNNNKCFEECQRHCQGMVAHATYRTFSFIKEGRTYTEIWNVDRGFVCSGYSVDYIDENGNVLFQTIADFDILLKKATK